MRNPARWIFKYFPAFSFNPFLFHSCSKMRPNAKKKLCVSGCSGLGKALPGPAPRRPTGTPPARPPWKRWRARSVGATCRRTRTRTAWRTSSCWCSAAAGLGCARESPPCTVGPFLPYTAGFLCRWWMLCVGFNPMRCLSGTRSRMLQKWIEKLICHACIWNREGLFADPFLVRCLPPSPNPNDPE